MNSKFYLAVIVSSLAAFFGGWLIFGLALAGYYANNTNSAAGALMKTPIAMWAIALGNIAWALLLTWILQKTNSLNFSRGFAISLWVSFLVIVTFDLSMFAFWNIYPFWFLVADVVLSSIFWGFVGGISGAILGTGKKVVTV